MIRTLLADDHALVLSGLKSLLETSDEIDVVGCCVNGSEVLDWVQEDVPDALVMDLVMPDVGGLEVLRILSAEERLPPTVVISAAANQAEVAEAKALGAWGIIMKDEAPALIIDCIHSAVEGEEWTGPAGRGGGPRDHLAVLTERERGIALRVASGGSNKAIARDLGIAEGTVKVHLHRIFKKLDTSNRVALALLLDRNVLR